MRVADHDADADRSRLMRPAVLAAIVAAGAVAAVLLARAAGAAFPSSDIAVTEMHVREALTGRVLLGPYSRFGWHHPGPIYFFLLAPFYAAAGFQTAGLNAGALTLSLAAIAVAVQSAWRDRGSTLAATLLAALALTCWRVDGLLASAWNAHVVFLAAVTLMTTCAAVASGRIGALPVAAAVASFAVQTDIALAPFAAAVIMAAVAIERSSSGRQRARRALTITAMVLAAAWAIPFVEEISHRPGNITQLVEFFLRSTEPRPVFSTAAAAWADAIAAPVLPGFVLARGIVREPAFAWPHVTLAVAMLASTVGAGVWAHKRGLAAISSLAATASVAAVAALWSATRIAGPIVDHLTFWFGAIGDVELAVVAAATAALLTKGTYRPAEALHYRGVVPAALLIAILGIGLGEMNRVRQGWIPVSAPAPSAPNFAASIERYMARTGVRKPLFRIDGRQWGLAAAILLELQRAGAPFAVEDSWMPMFPERFRPTGAEDADVTIAARGSMPELAARTGNETIDVSSQVHVEAIRGTRIER